MDEADFVGVETDAAVRIGSRRTVFEIAFDGASDAGKLAADLVVPSREEPDFQNVIPVGVADVRVDEFRAFGAGGAFGNNEGFVGGYSEKPVTSAPALASILHIQEPLKPV